MEIDWNRALKLKRELHIIAKEEEIEEMEKEKVKLTEAISELQNQVNEIDFNIEYTKNDIQDLKELIAGV